MGKQTMSKKQCKEPLNVPIRVSRRLRDALKQLGRKDESYADIIWRLMKSEARR